MAEELCWNRLEKMCCKPCSWRDLKESFAAVPVALGPDGVDVTSQLHLERRKSVVDETVDGVCR